MKKDCERFQAEGSTAPGGRYSAGRRTVNIKGRTLRLYTAEKASEESRRCLLFSAKVWRSSGVSRVWQGCACSPGKRLNFAGNGVRTTSQLGKQTITSTVCFFPLFFHLLHLCIVERRSNFTNGPIKFVTADDLNNHPKVLFIALFLSCSLCHFPVHSLSALQGG